jgi:hypothetical protein
MSGDAAYLLSKNVLSPNAVGAWIDTRPTPVKCQSVMLQAKEWEGSLGVGIVH